MFNLVVEFWPYLAVVAAIVVLYALSALYAPKPLALSGTHVLVTGGSSGIGKALAIEVVKRGANVTIIARDPHKLTEAHKEIKEHKINPDSQKVEVLSADLSSSYENVEKAIRQAEEALGPVSFLVNCAGFAVAGACHELETHQIKRLMEVNYYGSVFATKAVLPSMIHHKRGRIVFFSSQGGQIGIYGFTGYAAAKFALRGLAEALQMEVRPYNIHVTVVFPPDTDTPGLKEENVNKPKETRLISETAGLLKPEDVARKTVDDMVRGKFQCYFGFDGWMLACLTAGASPVYSFFELLLQVMTMGLFRLVSVFLVANFNSIVKKCATEKEITSKKQ